MKSHFKFVQNLNLMRKIVPFAMLDKFYFFCCVEFCFVCLQIYLEAAIHKTGLICLGNPQATVALKHLHTLNSEALTQLVTKHEKLETNVWVI